MSGRKLSGAQSRKRKKNAEEEAKKSSELFQKFFTKAKSDESESEDDGQLDHLGVPATNKTVEQSQDNTSLQEESNTNQLVAIDIDDDATKQIEHERQSQENNDSLEMHHISDDENSVATDADDRGIKPIDYIDESQDIKDSFNENNLVVVAQDVIPAVLLFHDVTYLEFEMHT